MRSIRLALTILRQRLLAWWHRNIRRAELRQALLALPHPAPQLLLPAPHQVPYRQQ